MLSSTKVILAVIVIAVTGCARPAPELPLHSRYDQAISLNEVAAVSSDIRNMSCPDLNEDFDRLARMDTSLEANIKGNRMNNQVGLFIGGIFPPFILTTENDQEAKLALDENQARRDLMVVAYRTKGCTAQD